jgi:hypothetical protein
MSRKTNLDKKAGADLAHRMDAVRARFASVGIPANMLVRMGRRR